MNRLKILLPILLMLQGTTACLGQTELKLLKNDCFETWQINCDKAKQLTLIMELYPLQVKKNHELEQLAISQKAKTDNVINGLNRKAKRKTFINRFLILGSFVLGVLIAK